MVNLEENLQYTVEDFYTWHGLYQRFKFYVNGEFKREKDVKPSNVSKYIESIERNGWHKAYTQFDLNNIQDEINFIEKILPERKKHLEEIKNNLIGG